MSDLAAPVRISGSRGTADDGTWSLVVNQEYDAFFREHHITCFSDLYDLVQGQIVKEQQDRLVRRFELSGRIFFLKRHTRERCQEGGVLADTSFSWCSEGGKEFAFFYGFRRHGLATAIPVAMGENVFCDGMVQSFFLTEDFQPYVQLEEMIRYTPEMLSGNENQVKRRNILRAVGLYARRMHRVGFNHQDFNATHVLLSDIDQEVPALALFDLQRVDQNPLQKFRWPIKALAEFNYSSRENNVFSDVERLFLFHVYCGREQAALNLYEKVQWRWIQAKTNRIASHTAKRHARNRKCC